MKNIKRILIVCTGNSCRSIMAEGYLMKRLGEIGKKDVLVISSGTGAVPGLTPTQESIEVMREVGVDVSKYISSSLSKANIDNADTILVMTPQHKGRILSISPEAKDKIYLLREFSREEQDNYIEDPIGRPIEFYREVFEVIKNSIEGFLKWLEK